jgi:hypothetical protein
MTFNSVADMSLEELRSFVSTIVEERLRTLPRSVPARSWDEVRRSIDENRWTPPPGAKSSLELLREDRDR